MKKLSVLICLLGLLCFGGGLAFAGGGQNYPQGAEDIMLAAVPPVNNVFVNYLAYFSFDEFKDNRGHNNDAFDEGYVAAEVMRYIWISKFQMLGATYGQHFFLPILTADLDFNAKVGVKNKKSHNDTNVPYVIWAPILLFYHLFDNQFHLILDPADIYIPLYNNDKDNIASIGRNYWGFEPVVAMTYIPCWGGGADISLKFLYDFYTKQDDWNQPWGRVDRTPGQEFHFDYAISYPLQEKLRLGITGYAYWQTTDDDYDMDSYTAAPIGPPGFIAKTFEEDKSRVWAIGPGIWYNYKNMVFSAKMQFEQDAKNIQEGTNTWFKFYYLW